MPSSPVVTMAIAKRSYEGNYKTYRITSMRGYREHMKPLGFRLHAEYKTLFFVKTLLYQQHS